MRSGIRIAVVALCAANVVSAAAGQAPSLPHADVHEEQALYALAAKKYRPSWAPLPMLRGSVKIVPYMLEVLKSASAPADRARSAFVLGQIGWHGSAGLLAKGLRDPDRSVRVQCGVALACMGDGRGVPVCAAALRGDEPWVRYYAAYGLWRVNGRAAMRILRKSLDGQGVLVTKAIRGALSSPRTTMPTVRPARESAKPTADEVAEVISNAFTSESDWWWHEGDFEQGVRCMQALVFLDPSDVQSFGLIAWLQTSLGRHAEAVLTLNRAIAANPRNPDAYFELGIFHMNTKDYADAEQPLKKAVELGGDVLAYKQYAHCLEGLGRLAESLEQWEIILKKFPNDPAAGYNHDRVKKLVNTGPGR